MNLKYEEEDDFEYELRDSDLDYDKFGQTEKSKPFQGGQGQQSQPDVWIDKKATNGK
jgi:hypothetical protein